MKLKDLLKKQQQQKIKISISFETDKRTVL